jgi:hypothetical protein
VRETRRFINTGYGWECKHCRASDDSHSAASETLHAPQLPRFFREGEAEERDARLSIRALARWLDTPFGRALHCPRCGAQETPDAEP